MARRPEAPNAINRHYEQETARVENADTQRANRYTPGTREPYEYRTATEALNALRGHTADDHTREPRAYTIQGTNYTMNPVPAMEPVEQYSPFDARCAEMLSTIAYLLFKKDIISAGEYQELSDTRHLTYYDLMARLLSVSGEEVRGITLEDAPVPIIENVPAPTWVGGVDRAAERQYDGIAAQQAVAQQITDLFGQR